MLETCFHYYTLPQPREYSACPLNTDEDVDRWLKFYDMKAPLICQSVFVSHDPVSLFNLKCRCTFALLPLLILGIERLVRFGQYSLSRESYTRPIPFNGNLVQDSLGNSLSSWQL